MLKILCIIQTPVPSTEISIIRPFSYLESKKQIIWQLVLESCFEPNLLKEVDIVIFHRNCHPNSRNILHTVKSAKIPIIYEIDDNYFEIPETLPIGRYMRNHNVVRTLEDMLHSADIVKIGSPELIPIISKYNPNIVYHPYAVDLCILDNITPRNTDHLTIGYAGTVNHHHDFDLLSGPILQIAKDFPHVHWDFIGCLPEKIKNLPSYSFTPFVQDYRIFLQNLFWRNWQIGLCPILDLPHNRCKTDNKLREYGVCQIAGIFSNIPPYSHNVLHQETGLLVDNDESCWYEAMKKLITDEPLRLKIATGSREWVEKKRSIPLISQMWLDLFRQVLK